MHDSVSSAYNHTQSRLLRVCIAREGRRPDFLNSHHGESRGYVIWTLIRFQAETLSHICASSQLNSSTSRLSCRHDLPNGRKAQSDFR